MFTEVIAHAGFVRTVQVELTLNCDTESNEIFQVDLAYETTKVA